MLRRPPLGRRLQQHDRHDLRGTDACDGASHTCVDACTGAATNHHSVGCDYYATDTETQEPTYCFAAFAVPPEQYLEDYVFFADPTYPETNLVLIRERGLDSQFHDVALDCAGVLANWQPVGDFEWTRADLMTGNFAPVGNCSTGRHQIKSDAPFGLWVWGWGTPLTSTFTENVSYGYPGGMNVAPINMVVIE